MLGERGSRTTEEYTAGEPDKWKDGRDADLIRFGFQGMCGTGTLQMLGLLCGDTHTHDTHKDINSRVERMDE